jgi:hypothetical protein
MNLISQLFAWGSHPSYSTGTTKEWLAGLLLLLIVAFLWSHVLKEID